MSGKKLAKMKVITASHVDLKPTDSALVFSAEFGGFVMVLGDDGNTNQAAALLGAIHHRLSNDRTFTKEMVEYMATLYQLDIAAEESVPPLQ